MLFIRPVVGIDRSDTAPWVLEINTEHIGRLFSHTLQSLYTILPHIREIVILFVTPPPSSP